MLLATTINNTRKNTFLCISSTYETDQMGRIMSKEFIKSLRVLLMGLDLAGKSTLLYKLQQDANMETCPTVGFNVLTLDIDKKTSLTIWDVGGQGSMRPNWKYYFEDCKALVFVVDASDRDRIDEAKKALKIILSDHNMVEVPLMVLANKSDVQNSMTIHEVSKHLDLNSYTDRLWEIQACSALTGLGLQQAFQSIVKLIQRN